MSNRKNHCPRHYRFVVGCPDCQAANLDNDIDFADDNAGGAGQPERNDDANAPPRPRFRYKPTFSKKKKKTVIFIMVILLLVVLISLVYSLPVFLGRVSLNQQLYENKAGGVDYWRIQTLDYWSPNFFLNYTGLIGAIIGLIIFLLPPEKTLIQIFGTRFGWGRPSTKKAVAIILPVGFIFFYFIGQFLDAFTEFSLTMYYISNGVIEFSPNALFVPYNIFFNLDAITMQDMFVYLNVVNPLISYIVGLVIFRLIINMVHHSYLARNDYLVVSNLSFIVASFFVIGIGNLPFADQINGIFIIQSIGLLIGFIGCFAIGLYMYVKGQRNAKKYIFTLDNRYKKSLGIVAGVLILAILIPSITTIPKTMIVDSDKPAWESVVWDVGIKREIAWTSTAAGLDMFETRNLQDFITGGETSDIELLNIVRQYDKEISFRTMKERMTKPFETLADSDIIYVNRPTTKGEYWVAPKTININAIGSEPSKRNTEAFDHAEGFFAIDTTTGEILDGDQYEQVFGVSEDYPIFFGEHQDLTTASNLSMDLEYYYEDAYDSSILLYTEWGQNNTNYKYRYDGAPDGNLTGLSAFWTTVEMGLWSEATNGKEKSFLINRNINTRVGSILLPGIRIDSDPYLVFDYEGGRMYYGLSLYCYVGLGLFARSPIMRFLGVCLVDVKTGDLSFYQNPGLIRSNSDPTYFAWKYYFDVYPWQTTIPDWLMGQMRYPEDLFEIQMSYQNIYHVKDSYTWYRRQDFLQRPDGSDLYYVEMDLGNGIEFVGVDLAKKIGSNTPALAGMYVIRHGQNFGKSIYYEDKRDIPLIGPATAQSELNNNQKTKLDVIQNKRFGNILLLPLGGSLYYYIPIYTRSDNIESLLHAGLVDAYTKKVGFGGNIFEAYTSLNIEETANATGNISLTILDAPDSYIYTNTSYASFRFSVDNQNLNDSLPRWDVQVRMKIYAEDVNITVFGTPVANTTFLWGADNSSVGNRYTVADWSGAGALYAGEGRTVTVKLTKDPESLHSLALWYQFELIVNGELQETTQLSVLTIKNSQTP